MRTMYKRVGIDPTKTASFVRGAAAARAKGRGAAADQLDGRRLQLVLAGVSAAVRALRRGAHRGRRRAAAGRSKASRTRESGRTTSTWAAELRWPTSVGPFGNPTSDSARTMVTTATTRALLVVFAPREIDPRAARWLSSKTTRAAWRSSLGCRRNGPARVHETCLSRHRRSCFRHASCYSILVSGQPDASTEHVTALNEAHVPPVVMVRSTDANRQRGVSGGRHEPGRDQGQDRPVEGQGPSRRSAT